MIVHPLAPRDLPRANLLPPEAREVLIRASATGEPGSTDRRVAIDDAIDYVRDRWPDRFTG